MVIQIGTVWQRLPCPCRTAGIIRSTWHSKSVTMPCSWYTYAVVCNTINATTLRLSATTCKTKHAQHSSAAAHVDDDKYAGKSLIRFRLVFPSPAADSTMRITRKHCCSRCTHLHPAVPPAEFALRGPTHQCHRLPPGHKLTFVHSSLLRRIPAGFPCMTAADAEHGAILWFAHVATVCGATLPKQVHHGIRRALSGTSRLSFFMVDLMTSLRASKRWKAWLDNHDTSHGSCSARHGHLRVQLTSEGLLILAAVASRSYCQ